MKILLVSDTHGITQRLEQLLTRYADTIDMAFHMGDYALDLLKFQHQYPKIKMYAAAGNMDQTSGRTDAPPTAIIHVPSEAFSKHNMENASLNRQHDGLTIMAVHGHRDGVKATLTMLSLQAQEQGAKLCFFGHTHIPKIYQTPELLIMNPGSLSDPRGGSRASYGIVTISEDGAISGELFEFENII